MKILRILPALLLFLEHNINTASKEIKLIYEKDISEHCRRRVVPSMFLGRQVIDANARIMQFSRLDLPYSCYISIRTESGSSMVMMIQVTSPDVQESCKNSEQLLVYEMGETFGGYWGPMPETVIKQEPVPPKVYTLKTTHYTTTPTKSTTEEEEEERETTQISTASSKRSSEQPIGDFVEVEIPLLNVSVHYVPVKKSQTDISDLVDTFDLHHDVTPIKGVAYDRSILPLAQFRLVEQQGGRRSDDGDGEPPQYELDIVQDFTPDMRLTLPQLNPTSERYKQKYQATRRLNFKKHRTLFHSLRQPDRRVMSETITRKNNYVTKYVFPTRNIIKHKPEITQDSWRVIEDLIKKLNKTKARTLKTTLSMKEATLLERMSNMNHNKSAYLSSNLSIYDTDNEANKYISTNDGVLSTWNPISLISNATEGYSSKEPTSKIKSAIKSTILVEDTTADQIGYLIDEVSKSKDSTTESSFTKDPRTVHVLTSAFETSRSTTQADVIFGQNNVSETQSNIPIQITVSSLNTKSFIDSKNKLSTVVTGSMVGHESWDNLVQAAPEMAVLLNQTVAEASSRANASDDITKETNDEHKNKMLIRKKRDVHAIAIENAQPHKIATRKSKDPTTQLSFNVADMQEFAQLVELQDDELHGRVALRHLNQYVGPPLFNLCSIQDPTKPHVHLFNSSRIVLSPTNFTFDRMVIILTAARALLSGELRCPRAKIECQVSGARICLDSMVACDGVPNCGSYDIYDEDRLMCGHTASLQHNVYLAAFTFLAVLLTIIYAVHYWLKRCVPKVADAFFVYSDGVENILYLDSIMRSPHDMAEDPKLVYHSHMYEDDIYEDVTEYYKTACQRFLRKLCCCCRNNHHKKNEAETSQMNLNLSMSRRMYSFTELEIRKMIASSKDIAVQTGTSLEMRPLEYAKDNKTVPSTGKQAIRPAATSYDLSINLVDSLLTLEEPLPEEKTDELSLLKFLKAAARTKRTSSIDLQADSVQSTPNKSPPENKTRKSHFRIDSPSEKEIEIHTYDRHDPSEPGPSERRKEDKRPSTGGEVPSCGSVSKHLRFDEITTTIPAGRYSDQDDNVSNSDGRRTVALGVKGRRSSRPLDTIEEADEQGGSNKEHRHFWGSSKAKKPKKKAHVSLR